MRSDSHRCLPLFCLCEKVRYTHAYFKSLIFHYMLRNFILCMLTVGLLCACGQKGPLYFPDAAGPAHANPQHPQSQEGI